MTLLRTRPWHISKYAVLAIFTMYLMHFLIYTHSLETLQNTESALLLLKNFDPSLQSWLQIFMPEQLLGATLGYKSCFTGRILSCLVWSSQSRGQDLSFTIRQKRKVYLCATINSKISWKAFRPNSHLRATKHEKPNNIFFNLAFLRENYLLGYLLTLKKLLHHNNKNNVRWKNSSV